MTCAPSDRFADAFTKWLVARAAFIARDPNAGAEETDRLGTRCGEAELTLIGTPAHSKETFFNKWELLEWLLCQESITGAHSHAAAPVLALAALKADFFNLKFEASQR